MADLFKDIGWEQTIKEHRADFPNFEDILRDECKKEQEKPEFKGEQHRIPIQNTSFSNFVI